MGLAKETATRQQAELTSIINDLKDMVREKLKTVELHQTEMVISLPDVDRQTAYILRQWLAVEGFAVRYESGETDITISWEGL